MMEPGEDYDALFVCGGEGGTNWLWWEQKRMKGWPSGWFPRDLRLGRSPHHLTSGASLANLRQQIECLSRPL